MAVILLVRLASYVTAAVRFHSFAALHTRLNKLTGAAVFLLPWVLLISRGIIYSWAICILAFFASMEEWTLHLRRRD